ncbi:MAG: cation transporter [Acutalibacteraceae bacterium]|nr:cation transporter [Oscillospiraceae bacterium]
MKKVFKLQDLDCANCAAKIESAVSKIDGVEFASVSFMTSKMTVKADDDRFESIMDEIQRICRKIEPDCVIVR